MGGDGDRRMVMLVLCVVRLGESFGGRLVEGCASTACLSFVLVKCVGEGVEQQAVLLQVPLYSR